MESSFFETTILPLISKEIPQDVMRKEDVNIRLIRDDVTGKLRYIATHVQKMCDHIDMSYTVECSTNHKYSDHIAISYA